MSISTDYTYYTFQVKHGVLTSDRVQVRATTVEDAESLLRSVRIDGERIERWKLEHIAQELKRI
jgi:hypothetical protein